MKRPCFFIMLVFIYNLLNAYENNLPNLTTPSILQPGQLEFEIIHRLYDDLPDVPENGFLVSGANVRVGLKACIWNSLAVYGNYGNNQTEFQIGANYSILPENSFIKGLADTSYFSYQDFFRQSRSQNIFLLLSMQTMRINKILCTSLNLGYDNFNQAFGAALGLDAKVVSGFNLFLEYGQDLIHNPQNTNILQNGYISAGFKIETWGHHFMFVFQNTPEIGMRRLLNGTSSYTNWYFGFTIQRLFDLAPAQQSE